jgi:amidase
MTDINDLPLSTLAARIAEGALTATALVEACLARIDAREDTVKAWVHIDRAGALAAAADCDKSAPKGPLHGIPVGIKDVIETADMPTTYGSPIYQGHRPAADAACVARLRAAGAIVLGKTVTTQFAHRTPGKTANPWNPAHTPGGSSSGSAAAVADRMVPLALGTQTAGSVIRPAAFCGIVGFKPSFGWTPFTGVKNLAASVDTLGYYVRCLDDLPRAHAALGGGALDDSGAVPETPPALALCRTPAWDMAEAPGRKILEETAERLAVAGAPLRELQLDAPFAAVFDAHTTVMEYEMVRYLAAERRDHWEQISPPTQDYIAAGEKCTEESYAAACAVLETARTRLSELLDDAEIVIAPSAPGEAPEGLGWTGNADFNRMWTSLHVPCLHLPVGKGPQGLPLGVTLIARVGEEAKLVAAGRWAARALDLPLFA